MAIGIGCGGDMANWNKPSAFYDATQQATYWSSTGSANTPTPYPTGLFISRYDHGTGKVTCSPPLDTSLGGDGHNSPAVIVIRGTGTGSDGKILCTWTGHPGTSMYVRRSTNVNDITAWDSVITLTDDALDTFEYGSLIQLSADNTGRIYRFYSGIKNSDNGRRLRMRYSDDQGATWSAYVNIVDFASGAQGYYIPATNWVDRIDWAVLDGAPGAGAQRNLWHFYSSVAANVTTYHQTDATTKTLPMNTANMKLAFDGTILYGAEQLDILNNGTTPAILFQTPHDSGAHDQRLRMVRWNGSAWVNGSVDITPMGDQVPHETVGVGVFWTGFGCIDSFIGPDSIFLGYKKSRTATGTVTNAASTAVTGSGTSFTTQVAPGSIVTFSNDVPTTEYLVNSVTDDTHLVLQTSYTGTTGAAVTMTIRGFDIQRWTTANAGTSWGLAENVTTNNLDYAHQPVPVEHANSSLRMIYRRSQFIAYNSYKLDNAFGYPLTSPLRSNFDSFTGTAATAVGNVRYADLGGRWEQYTGGTQLAISTAGRVYADTTTFSVMYLYGRPRTTSQYVQADFYHLTKVTDDRNAVILRQDPAETATYLAMWLWNNAGTWELDYFRVTAGTSSGVLATYAPTIALTTTYTVRMEAVTSGSNILIKGFINGAQVITYTDTGASALLLSTPGFAGIRTGSNGTAATNTTGQHLDNFESGDLATAGPPLFFRARAMGGSSWDGGSI